MTRSKSAFAHGTAVLVLDSCVVINLFATRIMPEILGALGLSSSVTNYTLTAEGLWVGAGRRSDPNSDFELVDLRALIDSDVVQVLDLTDPEADLFVELAGSMDDGEAIVGAIAAKRGFAVATDDRRAIRVFASVLPDVALVSTPQIMKQWSDNRAPDHATLRMALRNIHQRGRYYPRSTDPLYNWWQNAAA